MSGTARPYRVLKFGGTSVTGVERVEVIAAEVRQRTAQHTPVVVVSAFAGVTDALISAAGAAAGGNGYEELEARLRSQHLNMADTLLGKDAAVEEELTRRLDQLARLLRGVALLGECSPRTMDSVLATGEGLSSVLIAAALRARGLPAFAADPRQWIVTDDNFGEAVVDLVATEAAVRREAAAATAAGKIAIVPGFTGGTMGGELTTLGRGGSDHSGAVLGVSLPADLVEIWTDVDGVMSADPRVVPEAQSLDVMSFQELLELSHWGAKVVHPGAARLLRERGVPLVIKNTFHPAHPGTLVAANLGSSLDVPVRALASRNDAAVLQLSARAGDDATSLTARALAALHRRRVRVILVTQGGSEAAVCLVVPSAFASTARSVLSEEFKLERETGLVEDLVVESDCAVVSAVGDGMRHLPGVSGRVFGVLGNHGVNVRAIAQGASERNISVVVSTADGAPAVRAIHDAFFAPRPRAAELYVAGVGRVGAAFLDQLAERGPVHRLRIMGIGTSRKATINRKGIDPKSWRDALAAGDAPSTALVDAAIESPHHPRIFVDCTASAVLPGVYERLLAAGVCVVAANKVGFAGSSQSFNQLCEVAGRGGSVYYETTVGAGLPVPRTVADLAATGDKILRIQGVLSGTLGYLCDEVMKGRAFSEAVKGAFELGYTEPDPRDDLSGLDVARKLVILARSAGLDLEPEDVEVEPLLPREAAAGPIELFWERLSSLDAPMEKKRASAAADDGRLVYLGTVEAGKARVQLEVVPPDHPCWSLHGSENLILILSERYKTVPLVVRGPGAGPAVTAAGVFADVLRARAEAQDAPVLLPSRRASDGAGQGEPARPRSTLEAVG